jgi:hypothetical protein
VYRDSVGGIGISGEVAASVLHFLAAARRRVEHSGDFGVVKGETMLNESELTSAFRNVLRVEENHCKFPSDLTETEKNDLRILAEAILESGFAGDPYDVLRDAFERERIAEGL